jgi:hypothetical protein
MYCYFLHLFVCILVSFSTYLHHRHECSYEIGLIECMSLTINMDVPRDCFSLRIFTGVHVLLSGIKFV